MDKELDRSTHAMLPALPQRMGK